MKLVDKRGNKYIAVEETSRINLTNSDSSTIESRPGLRNLKLLDGRDLTPADDGTYKIVANGEILTVTDP